MKTSLIKLLAIGLQMSFFLSTYLCILVNRKINILTFYVCTLEVFYKNKAISKTLNDNSLPIEREAYLELVDWTGRAIRDNKRGSIPANLKLILDRLNINPIHWQSTVSSFKHAFGNVVGSITKLDDWRKEKNNLENGNVHWLKGN